MHANHMPILSKSDELPTGELAVYLNGCNDCIETNYPVGKVIFMFIRFVRLYDGAFDYVMCGATKFEFKQ